MISSSEKFQRAMAENSSVIMKADLVLADGTQKQLAGEDFMFGQASFSQSVSSSSEFEIGAAIVGSCDIVLNNVDDRFSEYDFAGATVRPYIGKTFDDGTTEWIRFPKYYVDQPSSYSSTIALSGLDSMSLLEAPYSDVTATRYPATLQTIVRDICQKCGLVLLTSAFPNDDYVVDRRPDDDQLTCKAALSYVAQIAGCWVKIDNQDRVVLDWYDYEAWEGESWLDGGSFDGSSTPYADGDDADGGNFDDYSSGNGEDGGDFDPRPYLVMSAFSSLTVCTDDVVVTGIKVKASDDLTEEDGGTGNDGEEALSGEEGYVLSVSDNPFVLYGEASAVASYLASRIVGIRFRPFDGSVVGDPTAEAGDPVMIFDARGRGYKSYVTSYGYKIGSYASVSCDAETPSRNSADLYSRTSAEIVDLRKRVKKERTARRLAVENLRQELENSSGLYKTESAQGDGSTIYYFHDKPALADSTIVWKYTAEAIGISTDGGETYPYGLDVSGDAILNRIYAIGIDADYLTTGMISDRAGENYWNLETGDFAMGAGATVGGKPVANAADTTSNFYYEFAMGTDNVTAPKTGWSTNSPTWDEDEFVWMRGVTVYQNDEVSHSKAVCIQGAKGATGTGVDEYEIQFYLSTSNTECTGGSWSTSQPAWQKGRYIWTRVVTKWNDDTVTESTPVLENAINGANEAVSSLDESLDAEGVFNRLTNTGAIQGLFKQDGKLYVNASYIKGGEIDASEVEIKNLMRIGDDGDNVTISENKIEINVEEMSEPAMEIGVEDRMMRTVSAWGGNYQLVNPGQVFTLQLNHNLAFQDLPMAYSIEVTTLNKGTFRSSGSLAIGNMPPTTPYVDLTCDVSSTGDGLVKFYISDTRTSNPKLNVFGKETDNVMIRSVRFSYESSDKTAVVKGVDGDEFLTKNRFSEQMSDGYLFTGTVSTLFISNNLFINYKLVFENGLLRNWYYVTPTSDEWAGPPV